MTSSTAQGNGVSAGASRGRHFVGARSPFLGYAADNGRNASRSQSHQERALPWERYEAANLTYSELKRSHELIQ